MNIGEKNRKFQLLHIQHPSSTETIITVKTKSHTITIDEGYSKDGCWVNYSASLNNGNLVYGIAGKTFDDAVNGGVYRETKEYESVTDSAKMKAGGAQTRILNMFKDVRKLKNRDINQYSFS